METVARNEARVANHSSQGDDSRLRRAAAVLLMAVGGQAALTAAHFAYGAHAFADPSRLHVVGPSIAALAAVAVLTPVLVHRRSGLALFLIALPAIGLDALVFGAFHGGFLHVSKDLAYLAGVREVTLRHWFASPDYAPPTDLLFEGTGVLGLAGGVLVAAAFRRLLAAWRTGSVPPGTSGLPPGGGSPSTVQGTAPTALIGLAFRIVLDAPTKSVATLLGVVVSVFLMAQQTSLLVGILGRVTSFVDKSGVDLWVMSLASESTDATDTLPASRVGAAAGTPGVAWAAPIVQGLGRVMRPDGVQEFVKVLGLEAPRYAGLPHSLAPGTSPEHLRASRRIFLNWNDRPTFAAAEPGDRIEIDGQAAVVSGFFQGMDPHSPYYYVFANIDDARAMTEFPLDRITYVAVGLGRGAEPKEVRRLLQARMPSALVKTREEFAAMEERYFLVRTPVGLLFGLGALVAAIIGAAIVAVTLYSTAVDRARDYGTLKAIGARQRDVRQLLLAQAWLFWAAGYALGLVAFFVMAWRLPQLPMVTPPKVILGVAGTSFASCSLASLVAVRRVLRLDPAMVFRG